MTAASRAADTTNDRHCRMVRPQQRQPSKPVHARHVEVEEKGIGLGIALQRRLDLRQAAGHHDPGAGKS